MRLRLLMIAMASMLVFAACGDDDSSEDGGMDTSDAGSDSGTKDAGGGSGEDGGEADAGSEDAGT